MATIRNRFYPLHDYSEHNVISLFSMDVTGIAGTLVKITTGSANPQNTDGFTNAFVGASIANNQAISYRYQNNMKVTATVSGDTNYAALGLTLYSTLEFDENGQPLRYNDQRAREIGAVRSGETVPVVTRGIFGIWGQYIDQTKGAVQPGNLVVISRSGAGLLAAVDPTSANFAAVHTGSSASWIYDPSHVVGKWLTSLPAATNTGLANEFSAQGGYALLQLDTTF